MAKEIIKEQATTDQFGYIPFVGEEVKIVDFDRLDISEAIVFFEKEIQPKIDQMAKYAYKISDRDAYNLNVWVSVHNIKECATNIRQYLGIVRMLLDNMRDDVNIIANQRKLFMQDRLRHIADCEHEAKKDERRRKEAERIRQKRYNDMEAIAIEEIAAKKYRRIK